MKSLKQIFFCLCLAGGLLLSGCQLIERLNPIRSKTTVTEPAPEADAAKVAAEPPKSWPNEMQQLTFHLWELLPVITDPKSYKDPEKKKFFESRMILLQKLAQDLNESTPIPDQDPSLALIGRRFDDNLKLSLESFRSGHMDFSRSIFKNAMAQCVQCHTRLETGPALAQPHFLTLLEKIAVVERVQFLLASRYFDEAMKEISQSLTKSDSLSMVEWQKLVQLGLIINVRLKRDVRQTEQFLSLLGQNKNLPYFIKRHLSYWQQSLNEWRRNPNPGLQLKTAQAMVERAESAQKAAHGDGGTIDYLRAASLLHQFLAKTQTPTLKAEALYELGLIYENVGEVGAWSMNEDYYELCLRTSPHSEIAKKCFARYEESTISGFSGSGGLYIPEDVLKKMNELRAIAL
jgi:hypothetical protein